MSLTVADGACSSPEGVVQVSPVSLADPGTGDGSACDTSCSDFVLGEVSSGRFAAGGAGDRYPDRPRGLGREAEDGAEYFLIDCWKSK